MLRNLCRYGNASALGQLGSVLLLLLGRPAAACLIMPLMDCSRAFGLRNLLFGPLFDKLVLDSDITKMGKRPRQATNVCCLSLLLLSIVVVALALAVAVAIVATVETNIFCQRLHITFRQIRGALQQVQSALSLGD